ncbi:hypothetical protein GCM10011607_12100 [Shewanella inventionis]|uniref:GNAT family N-acetyltransferase n=1 Tax=Shewanella inventionis TaxID=1738770 RepID=A0ABQ1IV01_9GAMM|nr:GNAT family N-acetyltransferase [Shewanella inventionis]GGB53163.1 hypothetical protein GCM10011607_12100 [Shewanella inventionis]
MEVGYEEIYSDTPYFDVEPSTRNGVAIAFIHMMYVPPAKRGQGKGKEMFQKIISELAPKTQYIRLKSASLGSGCTMEFWKQLGFSHAYDASEDSEESKILHCPLNGYNLPEVEFIEEGEERHYIFD